MTSPTPREQFPFMVYQHGTEYVVQAEDFEINEDGVHFVVNAGTDKARTVAFASHPAIVIQVRPDPVKGDDK